MCRVIVWDTPEGELLRLLSRYDLYMAAPQSGSCDILAVSPAFAARTAPCACRIAVAPGTLDPAFWQTVEARRVITYGWQAHNTLTLSSAEQPWILALQRELVTIGGTRIEQQEICLSPAREWLPAENPELILCAAGVLLAAGLFHRSGQTPSFSLSSR